MAILEQLKAKGWHLSDEGFKLCSDGSDQVSVASVIKKALDMDLREVGRGFMPEDLTKGKSESFSGSGVLQIQKIKNASAPKYEYGSGAPPILRLLLTDGSSYVNCLQWGQWKSVSLNTPPGTKIFIKPVKVPIVNNFLLLSENQFTLLGGTVGAMIEKWELNKQLASHIRTKENLDGTGPPPWIPFGKPINKPMKSTGVFKALETDTKEGKEDEAFKQQRLANIAEIAQIKETKVKSFGGKKERIQSQTDTATTTYSQAREKETRDFSKPFQDPNFKGQPYSQDKGRRPQRNDQPYSKQGGPKSQPSGYSNSSNEYDSYKSLGKDTKPPSRGSTLDDFITQEIRKRTFSNDTRNSSRSVSSASNKPVTRDDYPQTLGSDTQNLVNRMQQVSIHGYDPNEKFHSSTNPLLKPGNEVIAKYWEDNQYYPAVVHAVDKEGKTCVVYFFDYGNYEEVLTDDVKDKNHFQDKNWNAGSVQFQPAPRLNDNYASYQYHNSREGSRSYQGAGKPYGRQDGNRQMQSKQDYGRPSSRLYQPPRNREY